MRADDSSDDDSDVSDLFQRYRECSRHVWNTAFVDLPDGWHEFIDVDHALFDALVLKQIVEGRDWRGERETHGCYPSLRVQPKLGPKGIDVFWARARRGGYWPWEERRLTAGELHLAFIELFDWRNESDPRDAQYARARVLACGEHRDLVGADILIEMRSATFQFCSE